MASNSSSPTCYPIREAVSNGVLQGNNPINFALPLLIIQIAVVLLVTRTVALLFKPLRQPRVLAEIIVCRNAPCILLKLNNFELALGLEHESPNRD